jgi:hypothetical protein
MDACRKLVDSVPGRVIRPCEPRPLNAPPGHGVALVTNEPVDQESERLASYEPFADRASCHALRVRLDTDEHDRQVDLQRRISADLEQRLIRTSEDQASACARSMRATEQCAALTGQARTDCAIDSESAAMECREMTRRRDVLERERTLTPAVRATVRRCVAY